MRTIKKLILSFALFVNVFSFVNAAGSIPLVRGDATTINWNVENAASCLTGYSGIGYPDPATQGGGAGDNVYNMWSGAVSGQGSLYFPSVWADPTKSFPQSYTFTCTDPVSLKVDQATINISDCNGGTTWDTTNHICAIAKPTISSFTGPSVVDYGNTATLSYSVSGALSNSINGIGVSGGTYTSAALLTDTNFTLTSTNAGGNSVSGPITVKVAAGAFTAPGGGTSCSILRGSSFCQTTLAWNSVNMASPTIQNGVGNVLSSAPSSVGMVANVKYSGDTFVLKNGAVTHNSITVNADCTGADLWSGGVCVAPTCPNGANNPAACTQCSVGDYWNGSGCAPCSNGGCSGSGGNSTSPSGSLYCNNGSNQAPICTAPIYGSCSATHYSCASGGSSSNQSLADRWTWYCAGSNGGTDSTTCTEMKPAPTGTLSATGCDIPVGGSTCGLGISGTINNLIAPWVYINGNVNWTFTPAHDESASFNHGPWSGVAGPVDTTFTLADIYGKLDEKTVTQKCITGTTWDTVQGICVSSPIVNVAGYTNFVPGGVNSGNIAVYNGENPTFSWSAGGYPSTCTLFKNGVSQGAIAFSGSQNIGVMSSGQTLDALVKCTNANGSTDSSTIHFYVPPVPTSVVATCPAPGTTLTLTTTLPSGYARMYHRVYDATVNNGSYTLSDANDPVNPVNVATIPGHTYNYWVHTSETNGAYSGETPAAWTQNVVCVPSTPVVTATPVTSNGQGTGAGFFQESGSAKVTWTATNNPSSCTVEKGGVPVATNVAYTGSNEYVISSPGITGNDTYRVTCTNVGGSGFRDVTFTVPTPVTISSKSCTSPGTTLSLAWTGTNPRVFVEGHIGSNFSYATACTPPKTAPNGVCINQVNTNAYSFTPSTPDQTYSFGLYGADTYGNWSDIRTTTQYCTPAAPNLTLTASTPNSAHIPANSTTGIASESETVRLSWGATVNATSCLLDGISASTAGDTKNITATGWGVTASKNWNLVCTGPGGVATSTVIISYPPAPASITAGPSACNFTANGPATLTFSWAQPVGWSHFQTRASANAVDIPFPAHDDDFSTGLSKTFSINPAGASQQYDLSVATLAANGALSALVTKSKTCTRPSPVVTLTPTTANGGSTGSAYYNELGANLTWTANYAANTCDLYKDGALLVGNNAYPSISSSTLPAITSNSIYKVTCSNGNASSSPNVSITIPPKLLAADGICPAPGDEGIISWTLPNGYTGSIYRIFDIPGGSAQNCTGSDICNGVATGTSKKFVTLLDHTYSWAIWTRDTNNQNFSDSTTGNFTCKAPDLVAGNILSILPLPTTENVITTLQAYVNNNGSLTTGASFFSFFQIKNNSSGTITDLAPINSSALLPFSGNTLLSMDYQFPSSGSWSIRLCTDKSNSGDIGQITESNENNNCSPSWTTILVQTLPTLTINPNTTQTQVPGVSIQVDSTSTDPDNNIIEHNFDYFFTDTLGVTHSNYSGQSAPNIADVTSVFGTDGAMIPMTGSNTYERMFKPLRPGTYVIQAAVKESIFSSYIKKVFTLNVGCLSNEWWDETQKSCVKPVATLTTDCLNGALNAPTCDLCAPTDIYNNGKCITGTACYVNSVPLTPAKCGDGIVQRGEECDGTAGLSNGIKQKCTSKCTITCQIGVSNTYGSPSCGAGAGKVFNSQGIPVTACTNGALQSSAPSCAEQNKQNECPVGTVDTLISGKYICKSPFCGDGIKNGGEECDKTQGVGAGQFCASNCCLFNSNPLLLPGGNLPKFTLTCQNADRYSITNNSGVVVAGPAIYTAPVIFTPNTETSYIYRCYSSLNSNSFAEKTQVATDPPISTTNTSLASVFLTATPKSISANSNVSVSWVIDKPDNLCKIMAQPVITVPTISCDASCIASRYREVDRLNGELTYGLTDANDGARPILPAMRIAVTNGKSSGRKTVTLSYSTIFYSACSVNPIADTKAVKMKISVTGDQEG